MLDLPDIAGSASIEGRYNPASRGFDTSKQYCSLLKKMERRGFNDFIHITWIVRVAIMAQTWYEYLYTRNFLFFADLAGCPYAFRLFFRSYRLFASQGTF